MIRSTPLVLVLLLLGAVFRPAAASGTTDRDRPFNLVWISAEDMSPWPGCYG
ncbi:MAG: hypothetical protein GY825_04065, partial [Phycisphaeraceae bacterium]|nr:hypothetical protein [Phycisphaeraceae bacterium]